MSQLRFAVVGNLTWRLDLEDVALDAPNAQSATAQFQGTSVGGAAMQVTKVFKLCWLVGWVMIFLAG